MDLRYSFRVGHRGKYNRPVSCPVLALITSISRTDRQLSLERLFHILKPFAYTRARALGRKRVIKEQTSAPHRMHEIGNDFLVNAFLVIAISILDNPWHRNRKSDLNVYLTLLEQHCLLFIAMIITIIIKNAKFFHDNYIYF